ncbi:hypothetical protein EHE19_016460 [Ruminiclostridium herbifermentans]|uniref:FtsX-like permease family protein n=1 Tax=Ruminiclostridium herbifermentans TaxID=2488810 RepID=A0A4U7JA53_9FIRM|nr:hypothetical protein [Ruminiclostridium herbifermentans]QNU66437.1 hypothetical protein EHE19_016460 [Ruminiclostridium herbifermentans]
MRKLKSTFFIFNFIITIVFVTCFTYTKIQLNNITTPPYKLSTNTICITINENVQKTSRTSLPQVLEELQVVLNDNKVLLISENINSYGLGVFDPNGYYETYKLISGNQFNHNSKGVLVRDKSYTYKSVKNNEIVSNNGKIIPVIGVYDNSYPLFDINKEYIYNFFDDPALSGYCYLDHPNKVKLENILRNEIIPLLNDGGYDVGVDKTYTTSLTSIISKLITNSVYVISLLIILFLYINLFINYNNNLSKLKKVINVHMVLGGTRLLLTRYITKYYISSIIVGSICGGLFYAIVFNRSKLTLSLVTIFLCILINIIISYILSIIVVYNKCVFIGRDGKRL